jgi:predicted metalloendopeptidase
MIRISMAEAKAHFSRLLTEAESGREIVITRRGRPVACSFKARSVTVTWKASIATALALTVPLAATASEDVGIDLGGIDHAVRPGDDFFSYANGAWYAATPIPADRSDIGLGAALIEKADRETQELIRSADAARAPAGSDQRKIADYYASFMDERRIEARGLDPLAPTLRRIASLADRRALARYLGSTLRADVDILNATRLETDNLFGLWVAQDLDDPGRYVPFLLQGGLGLPSREYYLDESAHMSEIRARYREHIAAMFRLAKRPLEPAAVDALFDLEQRIARVHSTREQSGDVRRGDNHWTRAEFERLAPGLDWGAYFQSAGLEDQAQFVVWQPQAVTGISALVASAPLPVWKDYLTLRALDRYAPYLPAAFVNERFAFYGKVLSGTPELRARWKRGVSVTNAALGEAVGRLYVARYFPPPEKARAEAMVRNLLAAFAARIDRLEWMTPATRAEAKEKLAALKVGVGYPEHSRDYSAFRVVRGDALGNAQRAEAFRYDWNRARLGQPVDRSEWVMTPQTVNAVNLPALNALNFPAAILQPPYFDPKRPAAMDYGAIGAIIGHEISHSFDDQGALFDAAGKLRNWWTPEDFAHFEAAGARLVAQYSAYRPFPDLAVNGRQTLSENIADVAGLNVALDAFEASAERAAAPTVAGLSPEQQFFLSFAQSWREKTRPEALRERLLADGHAPAEYRADTVRNLDAWYPAFGVTAGETLYLPPDERVRVW